jgi:hypothetical protein
MLASLYSFLPVASIREPSTTGSAISFSALSIRFEIVMYILSAEVLRPIVNTAFHQVPSLAFTISNGAFLLQART